MLGFIILLVALFLCLLAYLIQSKKKHNLIAGVNSMSASEKQSYDLEEIAAYTAKILYSMAAFTALGTIASFVLSSEILAVYALLISAIIGSIILIKTVNSSKFKKNKH